MYFYLIPPVFLLSHLLLYLILRWWISTAFRRYRRLALLKRAYTALFCLLTLMPLLGCFLPDCRFKFAMAALGNLWLGVFFYLGLLCVIISAGLVLACHFSGGDLGLKENFAPYLLLSVVSLALILNIYGAMHAQDVQLTELDVEIDKPLIFREETDTSGEKNETAKTDISAETVESVKTDMTGEAGGSGEASEIKDLKIVLIADMHMSVNSDPKHIQKAVDLVNAQDPDLVFAAGDFLTSTYYGLKDPDRYSAILREIDARYGKYAVYGNHDLEEPLLGGFPMTGKDKAYRSEEVISFISSCGFQMLSDKVVEAADGALILVGREDGEKTGRGEEERMTAAELMEGIDRSRPVLVIEHEPVDFQNLAEAGADLVFSGHTHAGQFFPITQFTHLFNENNYGLKEVHGLQSVVTSGIGYYGPPIRLGCDSEVMVLNVHFSG